MYIQDDAPPHTARDTASFLDQQDVEVMDWPAHSPDMNLIEHVWDQMSVRTKQCWSRACLVVSGLFWPLEAGTHATSVGVRSAISCSTNM